MPVQTGLTNKVVAITGTLSRTRMYIERDVINAGGLFSASVTSSVDYLVTGSYGGRTKLNAANRYGTTQINEAEMRRLMQPISTSSQAVSTESISSGKMNLSSFFGGIDE